MSVPAGALIWISCRPLIRLAAGVASGILITKADIFPPVAARGAGQIALRITLPCLLFSKIVPAFSTENIKALGPLVLVAVLYEILGGLIAWIVKQFFWVPHRIRYGILVAGAFNNVGDIATAVILSLAGNAPFQGTHDQNLAVAYISVFMLVFSITLFPFGIHRWIAWDFVGPDVEAEVVQAKIKARRQRVIQHLVFRKHKPTTQQGTEVAPTDEEKAAPPEISEQVASNNHFSVQDDTITTITSPHDTIKPKLTTLDEVGDALPACERAPSVQLLTRTRWRHHIRIAFKSCLPFIRGLFNPVSIAIYLALPISLVPTLKALFIPVEGVHIPAAPDGQPPLAFIQDTATFIGAASIPIGLICLGSSLARLNVPFAQWRSLPVGAIMALAIGKMIIAPVLGVLISHGLVNAGVIFKDDKVLLFICMFFSCLPTATTQVYLTQVYSGTGSSEHLAAFLIPQYIIMFISMTAVNAYAIATIF
ncbi:hypothetical protein AGABI1DRAFT_108004 [Agaricus bisporus var. burnettii JB137-S8]|uniref:Auxin efflux carrier n=1 Tax=Agaricus bisporus var. burnettii (strain JB137-S8 / ATCC MYA-4627 / FGSC 10392) TaxID=597362 RepID=K5WQ37_AGABU|nr:uncharacterized protein AGABI1DRAFT_108004 [Agaricus bisporus var. burnettii JB137-S8]EKM77471.1 hypothetical protein AGABI1DRAFT_108004 [Agaricus bisporus var. burnettii JB137-S8]